jgi:glucose-6-phosphate dehydrogenase assembly protein OpcA
VVAAGGAPLDWSPGAVHIAHHPDYTAQAWLLAGWLASRLDWPSAPSIEASTDATTLLCVSIGNGEQTTRVDCDGRRVIVTHPGRPSSTIGIPVEGEADAVSAELHSLSHDARLHDALSALHRIFSAS